MINLIKAKDSIYDISAYVPGESSANVGRIVKLSSNEGPFGPSPKVIEAVKNMAVEMHRYPDGGTIELRMALAKKNNIKADNIVCGAGSDEIISFLCTAYAGAGDEVLYSKHGFLMYPISAKVSGATPVTAPEKDLKADPQALLNTVTDKTKILFLANPNNPTGSYLTRDEIIDLHTKLPKSVILVLDAAYAEYVDDPEYTAGHDLVDLHDNIVVTRTFSKAYGLGGMRLGWGHCPDAIADVLNRVRGPFNVSSAAQVAGVAALEDKAFLQKSVTHNKKCREWTKTQLEELGLTVYPSAGNFLLVNFGSSDKAEAVRLAVKEQGVLIRQMGGYGLPDCLRITIGTDEEMKLALQAITDYIK
jgi:histidinol-phosphate aminotransferase